MEPELPKRENALITAKYMQAWELFKDLRNAGIDAIIVNRFAVQIHPAHVAVAEKFMAAYEKDWRKDGRYKEPEVTV